MASSNIKLFDENKGNMLSDSEFSISNQRMNGLQTGVASSQLQNKAMYQASLVAYAIAQIMMQNGLNANDTDAVSAFVANLSGTMLQKVYDIATTAEAQAGVATGKWMSPALVKAAIDKTLTDKNYLQKSGGTMTGNLILNADPTANLGAVTKQYVDSIKNSLQSKIENITWSKLFELTPSVAYDNINEVCVIPAGTINLKNVLLIKEVFNFSNLRIVSTSSSTDRTIGLGILQNNYLEGTKAATALGNITLQKVCFLNTFTVSKDLEGSGHSYDEIYFGNKTSFPYDVKDDIEYKSQRILNLNVDGTNKIDLIYLSTDYRLATTSNVSHTYTLYAAILSPGL